MLNRKQLQRLTDGRPGIVGILAIGGTPGDYSLRPSLTGTPIVSHGTRNEVLDALGAILRNPDGANESVADRLAGYLSDWRAGLLDGETFIIDTLATLRHFADVHAVDMGEADAVAYRHYREERTCSECGRIFERADASGRLCGVCRHG